MLTKLKDRCSERAILHFPCPTNNGNLVYDISDHLPNFLIIKLPCTTYKPDIYKRDFSRYGEEELIEEIQTIH